MMPIVLRKESENKFPTLEILVIEDEKLLGEYHLKCFRSIAINREYFYAAFKKIVSYRSGAGVPKMLIDTAANEIGKISEEFQEEVVHSVALEIKAVREKLGKYFINQGYTQKGIIYLEKKFNPN